MGNFDGLVTLQDTKTLHDPDTDTDWIVTSLECNNGKTLHDQDPDPDCNI